MITDQQVRKLMKLVKNEETLSLAAAKAGMCEQTARKYLKSGKLPSESAAPHVWRTRRDPFEAFSLLMFSSSFTLAAARFTAAPPRIIRMGIIAPCVHPELAFYSRKPSWNSSPFLFSTSHIP